MISGLDLTATVDVTLKSDKTNPTIWKLGIIPSYLMARLSSDKDRDEIETAFKFLQLSLKGWENFNVAYETIDEEMYGRKLKVVPISILEQLPMHVITELSGKVMEVNRLSLEEIKN